MFLQGSSGLAWCLLKQQTITSDFLSKVLLYHIERIFTFQYDSFNKVLTFYTSNSFVLRLTSNKKQKTKVQKETAKASDPKRRNVLTLHFQLRMNIFLEMLILSEV